MIKTLLTVAVLTILTLRNAVATGVVDLYINDTTEPKTLSGATRLLDVVSDPQLATCWWPGAVLAEKQATLVALQQKQVLLGKLSALAANENSDEAAAINALRQQLQAVKVTGRQFIRLDPDSVRAGLRSNPPLEGHYSLWTGAEPTTITLSGLVSHPGKMAFIPGRDVAGYLDGVNLLSGADRSYAWVIYPDGRLEKVPVAYWNKRHIEPMPGSTLFVGFAGSLWTKKYDELNAEMLRALAQRVPEQ